MSKIAIVKSETIDQRLLELEVSGTQSSVDGFVSLNVLTRFGITAATTPKYSFDYGLTKCVVSVDGEPQSWLSGSKLGDEEPPAKKNQTIRTGASVETQTNSRISASASVKGLVAAGGLGSSRRVARDKERLSDAEAKRITALPDNRWEIQDLEGGPLKGRMTGNDNIGDVEFCFERNAKYFVSALTSISDFHILKVTRLKNGMPEPIDSINKNVLLRHIITREIFDGSELCIGRVTIVAGDAGDTGDVDDAGGWR